MELRLLALACLVSAAIAGPVQRTDESRCATECSAATGKFSYEIGKLYVYNYEVSNHITVGEGRQQQKAKITGKAEIYVKSKCDLLLQLKDVSVHHESDEEESSSLIEALEGSPLPFAWNDGVIEQVCATSQEPEISLNMKKAILSAFVNTMEDFTEASEHEEIDSLGTCQTKYEPGRQYGDSIRIKKSKSLKSCDNRHAGVTSFIAEVYQSPESKNRNLPIFSEENLNCEQQIRDNVVQNVVCTEVAVLKPISRSASLAKFEGKIKLDLVTVKNSHRIPQPSEMEPKSIRYSFDQKQSSESEEREFERVFESICSNIDNTRESSKYFVELIRVIGQLSEESLEHYYRSLKKGELCSAPKALDIFFDALPIAGTYDSIHLMIKIVLEESPNTFRKHYWSTSLALIPNPTEEAISAVMPLLSEVKITRPTLLGVSTMVYRICSKRDCNRIRAVNDLITLLTMKVGELCSNADDDQIIGILKSFGNMGFVGEARRAVVACAKSSDKPMLVRLAAIDAFRRSQEERPQEFVEMYADHNEDSEIRIAALISLMKRPDMNVLHRIEQVMEDERDMEVAAFTMSMMANLNETSAPLKQEIKEMLRDIRIKQYHAGSWNTSRNIEFSLFNKHLNLGVEMESNLVHSPRSILPHSGTMRFDVDLFGYNVNLMEFGVRTEGLEPHVKKILGLDKPAESSSSWKSSSSRSVPGASLFLRTLGTEFLDFTITDVRNVRKILKFANVFQQLADEKRADFAHSFMFLETKVILPSVTGRAYKLGVTGSATVGLTANGKFDVLNLMASPRNCDVHGHLQPSANIKLTATVGVHSEKSKPDMKIVTTLHTESDVEAKVLLKDGHIAKAKFNLPSDKIQFFSLRTDVFEVDSHNNERPLRTSMRTKVDHCSKSFEKLLGIEVCGKIEMPHPFISRNFPFARGIGNMDFSITKTDSSMKGYEISFEMPKQMSDHMAYELRFDTPGSRIQRRHSIKLEWKSQSRGRKEINFELESPFKALTVNSSFSKQSDMLHADIEMVSDKSRRYSLKTALEMSSSGSDKTFKPSIEWCFPDAQPVNVQGSVVYSSGNKQQISIDLKSNKPTGKPFLLSGNIMKDGEFSFSRNSQWKMSSYLNAKSPVLNMKIHSVAEKQAWSSMSSSLSVDYQKEKSRKHSVKFSTKGRNLSSPRMTKLSASAQFESTQKPAWNWMMSWDMQSKPSEAIKNDMIFKYGRNPETSFVHLVQSSKFGDSSSLTENRIAIEAPHLGIDSELKVGTNFDFKDQILFHTESDLRYSADKHIKSLIHLNRESVKPLKMSVNFKLEYPGRKVMFTDEIEEKTRGEFHGKTKVQWQEGQQANMDYKYKQTSDRFKTHHELETSFEAPFLQEPIQHKGLVRLTRESADIQSKFSTSSESEYNIDVKLRRKGVSHVSVSIPRGTGILEVNCEDDRKSVNLDIRCKRHSQHHIIGSASLTSGSKKSFQAELSWNADQDPSRKVSFTAELEASTRYSKSYSLAATAHYLDAVALDISLRGENTMSGPHKLRIDMTGTKFEPVTIILDHEIVSGDIHSSLQYHRSNSEKLKAELNGKFSKHSSGMEISGGLSVTSPDRSYEEKEIYLSYKYSHSHSSLSVASEMRVQLRANKMYKAHLDISKESSSAKLKASLMTPHRGWEKQHIAAELKGDESGIVMKTEAEWSPRKKFSVSSEWKITEAGRDHKLKVTSTFPSLRKGNFFVTFQKRMPLIHLESYIDINDNRKIDILMNLTNDPRKLGVHFDFKSEYTPAFLATFEHEKHADKRAIELLVKKDSDEMVHSKIEENSDVIEGFLKMQTKYMLEILEIMIRKELSESGKKYFIKLKGQLAPAVLTIQLTDTDGHSMNMISSMCMQRSKRICYSAKGYYKKDHDTSRYNKYHKVTLDVEQMIDNSPADHLWSINYLLSHQDDAFRSKLFLEASDKRIGYDLKKRSEAGDSSDLDLSVTLPFRTVRAKTQVTKSDYVERYAVEVLLDAERQTDKKWAIEMSRERRENSEERIPEYVGHVVLTHPALEKPVDFEYTVAKRPSRFPIRGKFELDYSRNPGDKLTAELRIDADRRNPEKKMYVYHIYRQDKDLDFSVKILKHNAPETQKYGWLWSWQSQREVKTGGFIATITNDRRLGIPAAVNITYYSPSNEIQLIGHSTTRREEQSLIVLKMMVNGREFCEATYSYAKPCLSIEFKRSDPFWISHACINKSDANRITLLSLQSYIRDYQLIEANLDFQKADAPLIGAELHWKKENFRELTDALNELVSSLNHVPWEELKEEMIEKVTMSASSFKNVIWIPVKSDMKNEIAKIVHEHKEEMKLVEQALIPYVRLWDRVKAEHLRPFMTSLCHWWERVESSVEEMLPVGVRDDLRSAWETFKEYTRDYCSRGSFCYDVKYSYRRGGIIAIYNLIIEKLTGTFQLVRGTSLSHFNMNTLRMWMHDLKVRFNLVMKMMKEYSATKTFSNFFNDIGDWVGIKIRHLNDNFSKYMYAIKRKFNDAFHHLLLNEDFKVLSSGISHVIQLDHWKQEDIQNFMKSLGSNLDHKMPLKWMKSKFEVDQYDLEKGDVKVKFQAPKFPNMRMLETMPGSQTESWMPACELDKDVGPCDASIPRYYFNTKTRKCELFYYGGCEGNANNFHSLKECKDACRGLQNPLACTLEPDQGPCKGTISRYFYNSRMERCEMFSYGGCQGNDNNFITLTECRKTCRGRMRDAESSASMFRTESSEHFFPSESSEHFFPAESSEHFFPAESSEHFFPAESTAHFFPAESSEPFFPSKSSAHFFPAESSEPFFPSKSSAHFSPSESSEPFFPAESSEPFFPSESTAHFFPAESSEPFFPSESSEHFFPAESSEPFFEGESFGSFSPVESSGSICELEKKIGPCKGHVPRFYYNKESRKCEPFTYGGCGGNRNNFRTLDECQAKCRGGLFMASPFPVTSESICDLPKVVGPCKARIPRYYYNKESGRCELFHYGGCQGNRNNFITAAECKSVCSSTHDVEADSPCGLTKDIGPCEGFKPRYYYDKESGKCELFYYGGCLVGSEIPSICTLKPDKGVCDVFSNRYFFNPSSGKCETFLYSGCRGNQNNFRNLDDCLKTCRGTHHYSSDTFLSSSSQKCRPGFQWDTCGTACPKSCDNIDLVTPCTMDCVQGCFCHSGLILNKDNGDRCIPISQCPPSHSMCLLEPDIGPCLSLKERFFFNKKTGSCEKFFYGGCSGNRNNFKTLKECTDTCLI